MKPTMSDEQRQAFLTSVEKPTAVKAKLPLTRRETAGRLLRKAVRKSDMLLKQIGDHGQISRQIDGVENLSFHHMFATWPPEVWCELIPLLAAEFGGEVTTTITMKKVA